MPLELTSTAFTHEGEIPRRYTCEGEDVSPPLRWRGVPQGTKSLALIVDDPDAPDPAAPEMTYVHWVVYGLAPEVGGLEEGASPGGMPADAVEGTNDWKRTGWGGPCPPIGRHRYYHKLYALDVRLAGLGRATKDQLLEAMEGHVLEEAVLMGTYEKGAGG